MKYQWHFEVVWENFPIMLSGIGLTIALSVLSMLAGAVLGMVIALARLSPWAALRGIAYGYTELFRTTPLLVQIVWVFYVLPLVTASPSAPSRPASSPSASTSPRSWPRSTAPGSPPWRGARPRRASPSA